MSSPSTDTPEAILRKVRALLDVAEHPNTPEGEAEAASLAAARLIDKWRIDTARLRPSSDPLANLRRLTYPIQQHKYLRASLSLLGVVARHYGCVVLIGRTGNSKNPLLVGDDDDITATLMMFGSLVLQRDRACLAQRTPRGMSTATFRNSYCYGWAAAIAERLAEVREAQRQASQEDSMALEVLDRASAVEQLLGDSIGGNPHNKPKVDVAGVSAGVSDGRNADLGQRRIDASGPQAIGSGS